MSIIPTGEWTMEKWGEKVIKISHSDDKWQITGVFAATLAGDYFLPQLIYKGKTCRCHPQLSFPQGWDVWHTENRWSNEETMRRYVHRKNSCTIYYKKMGGFEIAIRSSCPCIF